MGRSERRLLSRQIQRLERRNRKAMLTDKISATRKEVPNEPGCWFELRQVSGDELDEAQARFQQRTMTMEISQGMAQAMTNIPRGSQDNVDLTVERCDERRVGKEGR